MDHSYHTVQEIVHGSMFPVDQKEMARMGGIARAKSLTKKEIRDICRKAGKASGKARAEKAHQRKLAEAKALLAKEHGK